MDYQNKNNFHVVIPARSGSKRFPGKNMSILGEMPLIEHSLQYASKFFPKDFIWVNTDDNEIIEFARSYGSNFLLRPKELANDTSPTVDAIKYQINHFIDHKIECDNIILLQPTNPIRPQSILGDAIDKFLKSGRNSLACFSTLERKYGRIEKKSFTPINYIPGQRSQELDKIYSENGLIYITKVSSILEGLIITDDVYPLIYDGVESIVDIDYPSDMILAESILRIRHDK